MAFFFFQCAKNCFVLNKGKRYIRLKIPSHHSQKADVGGPSQLPCPACLSRGHVSHLRTLTRRSGGRGFSHVHCREGSLAQRAEERLRDSSDHFKAAKTRSPSPLRGEVVGKEQHRPDTPHFQAYVGVSVSLRSCTQHPLSNPLLWPPFCFRGQENWT